MSELYCKGLTKREYNAMYYRANTEKAKAQASAFQKANPERAAAYRAGVDPDTVTQRPLVCEVCLSPPRGKRALHLDHDHSTGLFRGWLCHGCNAAIGWARDSPDTLRNLATYLVRSK